MKKVKLVLLCMVLSIGMNAQDSIKNLRESIDIPDYLTVSPHDPWLELRNDLIDTIFN